MKVRYRPIEIAGSTGSCRSQGLGFRSRLHPILQPGYGMRNSRIITAVFILATCAMSVLAQGSTGTVTGKVVDAKGKAISGARVLASGTADVEGTTDAKGVFRLSVQPGEYRLQFEADGYSNATLREPVIVTAGHETKLKRRVELPEADQESVVRGSTFNRDGLSLAGARIVVERIPDDGGAPVPSFRREVRSDSMGLFAVRVPKGEGRYRLTATLERHQPATAVVDVSGGEIVNAPPLKLVPSAGS